MGLRAASLPECQQNFAESALLIGRLTLSDSSKEVYDPGSEQRLRSPGLACFILPACRAAGRGRTASHRVSPPARPEVVFLSLLAVSFFLRATLCFSAHASHLVWFGMACSRQCRHCPSSLALSRQSLAAFLEASLYSGGRCLGPSRPLRSSGVFSTFCGGTFFGGLGFGSDLGLVLPGFVKRCRSPGFSRVGVDGGLLAGSYWPLNLAGSGTRSRKVAPTARVCGRPALGPVVPRAWLACVPGLLALVAGFDVHRFGTDPAGQDAVQGCSRWRCRGHGVISLARPRFSDVTL